MAEPTRDRHTTAKAPVIRARALSVGHGRRVVLRDVDLDIETGERVVVTGHNGSGKSTLARTLAGLLPPLSGHLDVLGHMPVDERQALHADLAWLGHVEGAYTELTLRENLHLHAHLRAFDPRDIEARVHDALERVELGASADSRFGTASRGMQRRHGLARTFLIGGALVIIDEPEAGLDAHGTEVLHRMLIDEGARRTAADDARTFVIVTHDPRPYAGWATRALRVGDGRILEDLRAIEGSAHDGLDAVTLGRLHDRLAAKTSSGTTRDDGATSTTLTGSGTRAKKNPNNNTLGTHTAARHDTTRNKTGRRAPSPATSRRRKGRLPLAQQYKALLTKDLRVEWRDRSTIAPLITLAVLVALIANVAFDGLDAPASVLVAATTWTAIAFAAQVGLGRGFVAERDAGTLEALLAAPVDTRAILLARNTVNLIVVLVTTLAAMVAAAIFFGLDAAAFAIPVYPALLMGVLGLTLVTTLASALAMHGRQWVLLVPLLALPALFPLLAMGVPTTAALLDGLGIASHIAQHRVLFAYDVILLVANWVLAPYVLEP